MLIFLPQGRVKAYGRHADLLAKGLNPQHLVGLLSSSNKQSHDHDSDVYAYKEDTTGLLVDHPACTLPYSL